MSGTQTLVDKQPRTDPTTGGMYLTSNEAATVAAVATARWLTASCRLHAHEWRPYVIAEVVHIPQPPATLRRLKCHTTA